MGDYILVEKTQGVAILTMNRPEQLNAMNAQLSSELHDAVQRMSVDDEVGCIVITGAGNRAFSAGGDIHEQREDDRKYTPKELDARGAIRARASYEIGACPKPTIGMMNGLAYGGAGVLASSLDMRIGCEHASFRFLAAARLAGDARRVPGTAAHHAHPPVPLALLRRRGAVRAERPARDRGRAA